MLTETTVRRYSCIAMDIGTVRTNVRFLGRRRVFQHTFQQIYRCASSGYVLACFFFGGGGGLVRTNMRQHAA